MIDLCFKFENRSRCSKLRKATLSKIHSKIGQGIIFALVLLDAAIVLGILPIPNILF